MTQTERPRPHVVALGEAMIELAREPGGLLRQRYGGDTLNTAIYLARLGVDVAYLTALGDDEYSNAMLKDWAAEGVSTSAVVRVPGALPGLYVIETTDGERRFAYWRDMAPVRRLFMLAEAADIEAAIEAASLVYLSGISLAVIGESGRARLAACVGRAKAGGARIAFDTNYRPRLWPDAATARDAFAMFLPLTDIALASEADLIGLYGQAELMEWLDRLRSHGIDEIILKLDPPGVYLRHDGQTISVPVPHVQRPIDSTAAGDSFNEAYLAARLNHARPREAVLAGHRLAGVVIGHPGAIVPRAAMAGL